MKANQTMCLAFCNTLRNRKSNYINYSNHDAKEINYRLLKRVQEYKEKYEIDSDSDQDIYSTLKQLGVVTEYNEYLTKMESKLD